MRKLSLLLLAVIATSLITACADTSQPKPGTDSTQVSSIPWNRPEKWEGTGNIPSNMGTR